MKKIQTILLYPIILIIVITGIIIYKTTGEKPEVLGCATISPVWTCSTSNPVLTEDAIKGKEIFNSNCAACHKLDVKSTGPALRNVDSLVFAKWMIAKDHKIDTTKIEKLGIDFHRNMFKDYVGEKELISIIKYCNHKRY